MSEREPQPSLPPEAVQELSLAEQAETLKRTEIHGDPFYGVELDQATLRELSLQPRHQLAESEGVRWLSSDPYALHEGRKAVVAYIEHQGNVVARSYYLSNSHGLWRYLPTYTSHDGKVEWYSKGYSEESVTVPTLVQPGLADISGRSALELEHPDLVLAGTAHAIDRSQTYRNQVDRRAIELTGEYFRVGGKLEPEKVKLSDLNQMPNMRAHGQRWRQSTTLYGPVEMEALPSNDEKFTYIFCRDGEGRIWIGAIEAHGPIGSTGLREKWVRGGDLTTPAFEYERLAGRYGGQKPEDLRGHYVDMYPGYVSRIPMIADYRKRIHVD